MNRQKFSHVTLAAAAAAGLCGPRFHFDPDTAVESPPDGATDPVSKLRAEFGRLETEANTVIDAAFAADDGKGRELTTEEIAANDKRFNRMKSIQKMIDEKAKFAKLALQDPEAVKEKAIVDTGRQPPGKQEYERSEGVSDVSKVNRNEFGRALARWADTDKIDRKFATITTTTNSGLLLPARIVQPKTPNYANTFRQAMSLMGVEPIETTDTAKMVVPVADAAAGGIIAQGVRSDTENPDSFADSITLTGDTVYEGGTRWFSNTLLLSNSFDLLEAIVPQLVFSKEVGGLEATIAASIIADAGITNIVNTATTTSFTYANWISLNNAIPKRWGQKVVILVSQAAYTAFQNISDTQGRPILNPDPQNASVMRMNGTPVLRCDYLESFGLSKVVGVAISMLGFMIRDVTPQRLTRYVNNPSYPDQTGINLFANHGFGYAKGAMAILKTPAS